jgi:hypothetical protein
MGMSADTANSVGLHAGKPWRNPASGCGMDNISIVAGRRRGRSTPQIQEQANQTTNPKFLNWTTPEKPWRPNSRIIPVPIPGPVQLVQLQYKKNALCSMV